jgi:hypothetical protein
VPRRRPDPDETRVDGLFEEPPERFTEARDALAKELRAHGDTDAADAVRRLRRPTLAAWALNQVARRHADEVRGLIELGDDLRRLGAERRTLVEQLSRRAEEVLAGAGRARSPALQQAVVSTLEAAALSAEDGAALLGGRLVRDLAPESGFGATGGFTVVPSPPARRGRAARPVRPSGTERAERETRDDRSARERGRALDEARGRVAEAEAEASRRRDDEAGAVADHDAAVKTERDTATRVRELERGLRDARSDLDRDREAARAAKRALDQARRAAARAAHELDIARASVERLEAGADDGR